MFKRDDPSKNYHVVSRIAQGGFAKVFKVQRHSDNKYFALKFIEPKNKQDYQTIKNEVAIMLMCTSEDSIL